MPAEESKINPCRHFNEPAIVKLLANLRFPRETEWDRRQPLTGIESHRRKTMKFRFAHNNFNVFDLEKSIRFYREALRLKEVRRKEAADGSFILVFLGDGETGHQLELTWLRDRKEPYNLGDNEFHLALVVDDFAAAHALHGKMGCICYENEKMGIYFIHDPDDYWIEIVPVRRS
jgi:lactoylglutathione lyase